ncbi:MAG: PRC-barrel domain-containing protein [Ktedonobacteraceae bacterium]
MENNEYINQPTNQPIDQQTTQPINPPTDQTVNQPVNPPADQTVNQPVNPPTDQTNVQPVGQSIKKWTDLKDLAVVAIANGSKVGTLDDFYFDPSVNPAANSIRGFRIKTGMFSHRVLPASVINAIGTDAVTIDDEEMLHHEKDEAEFSTLPLGQSLLSYKVMSEGGTLIGTIGNMLLDITTPNALHIYAFELSGGLRSRISGHYSTFYAQQVVRYGQDVLVIPDAIGTELSR